MMKRIQSQFLRGSPAPRRRRTDRLCRDQRKNARGCESHNPKFRRARLRRQRTDCPRGSNTDCPSSHPSAIFFPRVHSYSAHCWEHLPRRRHRLLTSRGNRHCRRQASRRCDSRCPDAESSTRSPRWQGSPHSGLLKPNTLQERDCQTYRCMRQKTIRWIRNWDERRVPANLLHFPMNRRSR